MVSDLNSTASGTVLPQIQGDQSEGKTEYGIQDHEQEMPLRCMGVTFIHEGGESREPAAESDRQKEPPMLPYRAVAAEKAVKKPYEKTSRYICGESPPE